MSVNGLASVVKGLRKISARQESSTLPDEELLRRFVAARDEAAFESLVARHGPMVLNVCRQVLHDQHSAEDAFQATFLVLVRKAGSIGRGELLANWLYGVACRTAARARVEAAKRRARETAAAPKPATDPLAEITVRELFAALHEEMSSLPSEYRGPLVLCYLEGKTRDEAARQFGWSLATLARRLERGRELLSKRLARRGLGLSMALFPAMLSQGMASAFVPTSLVDATMNVAAMAAGGRSAAGVISANVSALTEGVLKTVFISKLKIVAATLLVVALLGVGVGGVVTTATTRAESQEKRVVANGGPLQLVTEKKSEAKKDKEALRGKWAAVSIEVVMGNSNKTLKTTNVDPQGLWMTFDGEKMVRPATGTDGKPELQTFKVTFDPDKAPSRFTVHTKFHKLRHIYEVEGDTLRLCSFCLAEQDGVEVVAWPTKFSTDDDREMFPRLEVWKRVKDNEQQKRNDGLQPEPIGKASVEVIGSR